MSILPIWTTNFQVNRGIRAYVAIGVAIVVCHHLGKPPAPAALGAFLAMLVDSGGPYRTRVILMATVLIAGVLALIIGANLPSSLALVVLITTFVAFVLTYARVLSQTIASTSVPILIFFFAGVGGMQHTLASSSASAVIVLAGGIWAVILSLFFWPLDAFRPARLAVADCYESLALFSNSIDTASETDIHAWRRRQRTLIENARAALSATGVRAASRTIRARNLAIMLETAEMLLARSMRLTEVSQYAQQRALMHWLATAEGGIASALRRRPVDRAASFALSGSQRLQLVTFQFSFDSPTLAREQRDSLLELTVAFDAVRSIWTGVDLTQAFLPAAETSSTKAWDFVVFDSTWLDSLRANFTLTSANLRHALRVALVSAADISIMRLIHFDHGFWLPLTSFVLMQPFSAGTTRKSVQRVQGTIAGGVLAALLAAVLPGPISVLAVVAVTAGLTLGTLGIDYAVFCFFVTPTFVLLSLPHTHDWRYAGFRIGLTLAGAFIAVAAMRLLWPQRAEAELAILLRRGAHADAAYLRAVTLFWTTPYSERLEADRSILGPARRACGLTLNDAEEALDRVLEEPQFISGRDALSEQALSFTTYLRRLTHSITTLASFDSQTLESQSRLDSLILRLDAIGHGKNPVLTSVRTESGDPLLIELAADLLQRMERQVAILERTATCLL